MVSPTVWDITLRVCSSGRVLPAGLLYVSNYAIVDSGDPKPCRLPNREPVDHTRAPAMHLPSWTESAETKPPLGEVERLMASGYVYRLTRELDATTDIHATIVRDGKNLKGRLLGLVLGTVGKGVLAKAFANSVKAIEKRALAATADRA
jgi:hypothetical protein